ncbi:MAG: APC family permease [Anaerovoracaceae bacterium]
MTENKNKLSKVLGRTDVIALGFGTMAGWSWVMLATTWLSQAGFLGTILAFALGALIILGIGLTYGELTAALPIAGGELAYVYRAFGQKIAWVVGWVLSLAYLGVAAWEGIALATAINWVFPITTWGPMWEIFGYTVYFSWAVVGMIGAVVMLLLNLFAAKPAMIFQVMATAALLILGLLLLFGGVTFGSLANVGESFKSTQGFVYVFLMVPAMLVGFDVIPQSAEEMNLQPKSIGKMVVVCITLSIIWYLIVIVGLALSAPIEIRSSGMIPAADAISYAYGDAIFGTILVTGGILGILTSWNGFFMGSTRLIFAMSRAKMLPALFGKIHTKYKTPWAATILVGVVCIGAPLLGKNALVWFVDTSSLCAFFSYCWVVAAFLALRIKEPDLNRPWKIKGGIPLGFTIMSGAIIYFVMFLHDAFTTTSSYVSEMYIIGTWVVLGIVLAIWARKDIGKVSREEQERLIFGDKLARRKL